MGNINDSFYTTGGPKGSEGLKGVLGAVGNAVAKQYGLRAPGTAEGAKGRATEILGRRLEHEFDDSFRLVDKKARALIGKAGAYGLHVNFETAENGDIVRTEEVERKERVGITTEVGLKHSYKVRGYASHRQPLAQNIDRLDEENIREVEKAVEENGKAATVYELLSELMSYHPDSRQTSNAEKMLGLNDDLLYKSMNEMLAKEIEETHAEIDSSFLARISDPRCFIVEQRHKKVDDYGKSKEKQILALRKRFAYKDAKAFVVSEIDGKIPVLDI